MPLKKDGFKGQQSLVLPKSVVEQIRRNALIRDLIITDIGFYPHAEFHYKSRRKGANGNIIILCTDGSGWYEVHGEIRKIHKNDVCIIPAGVPHKYGADPQRPWTIYWLHVEGEKANLLVANKAQTIGSGAEEPELYLQRIRLFDDIYSKLSITYNMRNMEYANILAGHLLASIFYQDLFQRTGRNKATSLVERSLDFMRGNLDKNLTLLDFAVQAGLSASQYSNVFKQKTSTSPMNFYAQLKIQKSVQLMDDPGKRIKEIALELGFEDPFYFSRVFAKIMGMSPARFRSNNMHNP